ncbi:MAG: hypothetical protein Q4E36_02090 [Bacillota bacterium]|nr:hypothetical protein [Bacillota bacterium]
MEGILLVILALVQFKKYKLAAKFRNRDGIYLKSFVLILGLGAVYLSIRTFMDLRHLGPDLNISYFKPLLGQLKNISDALIESKEDRLAGWAILAFNSYKLLLADLGLLNLAFFLSKK